MNWVKPFVWLPPLLLSMLSISACSTMTQSEQGAQIDERKTITPARAQNVSIQSPDVPVHVQPSPDGQIQVHLHGVTDEHDPVRLDTKQRGNQLRIDLRRVTSKLNQSDELDLQLDVQLPPEAIQELTVQTASGDIILNNYQGNSLWLNTATGTIEAENIEANTSIQTVTGPVELKLGSLQQDLTIQTLSGDMDVYLPNSAGFVVDLASATEKPKIEFALQEEKNAETSVRGTVGSGGPMVQMNTKSGNLKVHKN